MLYGNSDRKAEASVFLTRLNLKMVSDVLNCMGILLFHVAYGMNHKMPSRYHDPDEH